VDNGNGAPMSGMNNSDANAPRAEGEKRSRRGGRRRRGRGGSRGPGLTGPMDNGNAPMESSDDFSLQHSAGPRDVTQSEPRPDAASATHDAPQTVNVAPPPPPPPVDNRPAVVWSSSTGSSASFGGSRSERDE
jgi:hypothetical protein